MHIIPADYAFQLLQLEYTGGYCCHFGHRLSVDSGLK